MLIFIYQQQCQCRGNGFQWGGVRLCAAGEEQGGTGDLLQRWAVWDGTVRKGRIGGFVGGVGGAIGGGAGLKKLFGW